MDTDGVVAIIQARMGSTRLPGKSMMKISGKPLLWHVIQRVRRAKSVGRIVVATTRKRQDDAIAGFCRKNGVPVFRGNAENVLGRYFAAAKRAKAKTVVRITADCPLADPGVIDSLVGICRAGKYGYCSNVHPRSYPTGMDAEVFSFQALSKANEKAKSGFEREHVTPYMWQEPGRFRVGNLKNRKDLSGIRLTVDYAGDMKAVRRIYALLGRKGITHEFGLKQVLALLRKNPELGKASEKRVASERD